MADVFSKKKRSAVMGAIRGKGNKSTEVALRDLFRKSGIQGWRRHLAGLPGHPDFSFPRFRLVVFVDGCFWHGCRRCHRNLRPSSNAEYWRAKIARNRKRDKTVAAEIKKRGWRLVRIWEHQLRRRPKFCVEQIRNSLARSKPAR